MSIELAPQPPAADKCHGFISELVLRCGRGDEAALGDLFDLTYFLVAAAVKRGVLTSVALDDDVIEAFRRIWCRSVEFQPTERGVLAWVYDQAADAGEPGRALPDHDRVTRAPIAPVPVGPPAEDPPATARRPLRVDVLSRNAVTRAGLTQLLSQNGDRSSVVEETSRGGHLRGHDVVVFDLTGLIETRRTELAAVIAQDVPVVALTPTACPHLVDTALAMGATGTVSMDTSAAELLRALEHAASAGTTCLASHVGTHRAAAGTIAQLSDRELTVLRLIGTGLTNHDLADELHLSINTIKSYIRSAYRKIGVTRRAEAVLWAVRHEHTAPLERSRSWPESPSRGLHVS